MSRAGQVLFLLLVMAVLASAMAVVYSKYLSRKQFVVLQELQAEKEQIGIEWGRLQLEESTLATHSEVEKRARDRLKMHLPKFDEVVVIRR
ncbi:MAG: cell division protein FtsL [gamma proteobacterium symbiont of Ctena orbiculata]|uniref:Cell division protein FtsL n=1 Tax=Candidatus Thiodiazotropha taylori TaxID=2792791 RepID=A0A944QTM0_9GAMM|nr:cell division protein FtsL [Candidatus Thiodiazotropha taylori]PUB86709.1 MAG: cell division protein FtsL [gamma proteobacterium symbiont of Ctena orbiculata]MBT2987781.1 cell division protein FtsL [Candidatus Thiodiazotropha taylori]MBT2995832.1 cell division protein FtsL [Candidatus Thiodiazotropha taylori]MBT2999147.1 cell division protein FtsL [Candidatus Thiodiazotropha taylori]